MEEDTRTILRRWQALEDGSGLRRAKVLARVLSMLAFALFILVAIGLEYALHPVVIVIAALAAGWLIAETNALRSRLTQWPIFKRYIDWSRVRNDLDSDNDMGKEEDKLQPPPGI